MSLLFEIAVLRDEVTAFQELARRFLEPSARSILNQLVSDLDGISKKSSGASRWQIYRDRPLRTVASIGDYMPDEEGELCVHAAIDFVWDLEPVRPRGDTRHAKKVRLSGLASTEIRLIEGEPGVPGGSEIAVWRMEVADDAAPGCHFHVQVLGRDGDDMFPKALDVPRLPGSLVSPFACMEFVLSELFQAKWSKHVSKDSSEGKRWRKIQAFRHQRQLRWHLDTVDRTSGSPWVAWKLAKPPEDLFLQ